MKLIAKKKKLNSIESMILKIIEDPNISENSYVFIKDEVQKYCELKEDIRKDIKIPLSYFQKKG